MTAKTDYVCPGESHPISRSVHLARLAAFYPACRDCPCRGDLGQLPPQTVRRLQSIERRVERASLFVVEGVRGIYLNELNRRKAGDLAAAFAALLWETAFETQRALKIRTSRSRPDADPATGLPPALAQAFHFDWTRRARRARVAAVVVGYDERPSSPDLTAGVVASLGRMGCEVIDIGLCSKPCFWFAVDHLQAAAGVFVTGNGCDGAWTGLDFALAGGTPLSQKRRKWGDERRESRDENKAHGPRPVGSAVAQESGFDLSSLISHLSSPLTLDRLEDRLRRPLNRPTRHGGVRRSFRALVPYEAALWKHFHALRPLVVCVGCSSPLIRRALERMFATFPGRLVTVDVPAGVGRSGGGHGWPGQTPRAPALTDSRRPGHAKPLPRPPQEQSAATAVRRIAAAVRRETAHLGVLIDDDGQRCTFLDERGRPVPSIDVLRLVAAMLLSDQPGRTVAVESPDLAALHTPIRCAGGTASDGGTTLAEMSQAMRSAEALLGGGSSGRFWFRESFPTCDAIVSLALLLQALSVSELPFSLVAADGHPALADPLATR